MENKSVVLFAHGSSDPLWQAAVELLKQEIRGRVKASVSIAYMERCQPSLDEVMEELHSRGVRNVLILPLFLAPGGHMSNDVIPGINSLRKRYPEISMDLGGALLDSQHVRNAIIEDMLRMGVV